MKICTKCLKEKENLEFNKRSALKSGFASICKDCNKENLKNHYNNNKKYYADKQIKTRKRNRKYIDEIKYNSKCEVCFENDIACLDFHHLHNKKISIANMSTMGNALSDIDKEINKCAVLCSNCHRKLHYHNKTIEILIKDRIIATL